MYKNYDVAAATAHNLYMLLITSIAKLVVPRIGFVVPGYSLIVALMPEHSMAAVGEPDGVPAGLKQ